MFIVNLSTLVAIYFFAFSQKKNFKVICNQQITVMTSNIFKITGCCIMVLVHFLLFNSENASLNYVVWLAWLSVNILFVGGHLSYFHKKNH